MKATEEKMFRDYAWAYFEYHADQRMKTFNFFIVVAGLLAGGITSLLKDGVNPGWISPLGVLLFILSVVFWKLDQRNRNLVRNGEAALKHLDDLHRLPKDAGIPHVLSIFERDDYFSGRWPVFPLIKARLSYTKCLGVVFTLFAILGLFFSIGSFYIKPSAKIEPLRVPNEPKLPRIHEYCPKCPREIRRKYAPRDCRPTRPKERPQTIALPSRMALQRYVREGRS